MFLCAVYVSFKVIYKCFYLSVYFIHNTEQNLTLEELKDQLDATYYFISLLMCSKCFGFSLQHGYHSNQTTPKLQHTSNQEQYDQCGNSTE